MSTPNERAEQIYGLLTQKELEILISYHQAIQKSCHYTTEAWQSASIMLQLYFVEMARRQRAGLLT